MTFTRFALNTAITKAYDQTESGLMFMMLTPDDLSNIYNDVYKELGKHSNMNPIRKFWIRSLKKELLKMIEELYQIPNN